MLLDHDSSGQNPGNENIWGSETDPEHPSAEEPLVQVVTTLAPSMKVERGLPLQDMFLFISGSCITKALDDTIPRQ